MDSNLFKKWEKVCHLIRHREVVIYRKYMYDHSDDQIYISHIYLCGLCSSWLSASKPSQFPKCWELGKKERKRRVSKVSFDMLMRHFGSPWGWGWLPVGANHMIRGWNFHSHLLTSRKGKEASGQWFNVLLMEWSLHKPERMESGALWFELVEVLGQWCTERGRGSFTPLSMCLAPCFFVWLCLSYVLL